MTNGDKIRSMTDEELADWFAPHMLCTVCDRRGLNPSGCDLCDCEKNALIYMQKEMDAEPSTHAKEDLEAICRMLAKWDAEGEYD